MMPAKLNLSTDYLERRFESKAPVLPPLVTVIKYYNNPKRVVKDYFVRMQNDELQPVKDYLFNLQNILSL